MSIKTSFWLRLLHFPNDYDRNSMDSSSKTDSTMFFSCMMRFDRVGTRSIWAIARIIRTVGHGVYFQVVSHIQVLCMSLSTHVTVDPQICDNSWYHSYNVSTVH